MFGHLMLGELNQIPENTGALIPIYWDGFVDSRRCVRDLVGFTGSSGVVAYNGKQLILVTDARYTIQASQEIGDRPCVVCDQVPDHFFADVQSVYVDQRSVSFAQWCAWEKRLASDQTDLCHYAWGDEAMGVDHAIEPYHHTRKCVVEKVDWLRSFLKKKGASFRGVICAGEDALSWLLNVRMPKRLFLPACPIRLVCVTHHAVHVFVRNACGYQALSHLPEDVHICDAQMLADYAQEQSGDWLLDPKDVRASDALLFDGKFVDCDHMPYRHWCAIKDTAELEGAQRAHYHEAVALIKFLAGLSHQSGSEQNCVDALEQLRAENSAYWGPSFPTISAFGAHSAVVHYQPGPTRDAHLGAGVYLLDAGGQYDSGTTDMTRTVCIGPPSEDFCRIYTQVLQAHIALASSAFPVGTQGGQLDAIARHMLWRHGLDYGHSTGHGVGAALNVHEYPPAIGIKSQTPILPGMIVSIEPGHYVAGKWGVRLENLYYVEKNNADMCQFKPLTCVPFEGACIDVAALTSRERAWLNEYHRFVQQMIMPLMPTREQVWLQQMTTEI